MPGVTVQTAVRSGPGGIPQTAPSATFFCVGTAERGTAAAPVLLTSMQDFEQYFGLYNASFTLHQNIEMFFEEGGATCYVQRVSGTGAVAGLITLYQTLPSTGATVVITAAGAGAAANAITVAVLAPIATGTSQVRVQFYLGTTLIWTSTDLATRDAIVSAINANVGYLVTATAGATNALPATNAALNLATGADGSAVTAAQLTAGLPNFSADFGTGCVAIPGQPWYTVSGGSTVGQLLLNHAQATNRIALLSFGANDTVANIESDSTKGVQNLYVATYPEYGAIYYPWVNAPDGLGGVRALSPECYVAGVRAKAHDSVGAWKPAAGEVSIATFVQSLAPPSGVVMTSAIGNELDTYRINALRVIGGDIRIYGAHSVSSNDVNWRFITYRDTVNAIIGEVQTALEPYVFTPIDARGGAFAHVEATTIAVLDPIATAGGLFPLIDSSGNVLDVGYSVTVSAQNNPVSQLALGILAVELGVRISSVGQTINVTIFKSGLTASV